MTLSNISNKKLAYFVWFVAAFNLFQNIFYADIFTITLITGIVFATLEVFLGYAIFRERNDALPLITIIVLAAVGLNITFALIAALMLAKKFLKNNTWASKCWFVPAAIAVVSFLISLISIIFHMPNSAMAILGSIFNIFNYLILGYWFVKITSIEPQEKISKKSQLSYYAGLHDQGVLSDVEFEAKKAEIEQSYKR